ncbi:hypothetical protein BDW22DRAFT_958017 [Trametopsis cervina]|nr:hypothetical protein BDW22DRAFT_958017 [Trametopsis cervina]
MSSPLSSSACLPVATATTEVVLSAHHPLRVQEAAHPYMVEGRGVTWFVEFRSVDSLFVSGSQRRQLDAATSTSLVQPVLTVGLPPHFRHPCRTSNQPRAHPNVGCRSSTLSYVSTCRLWSCHARNMTPSGQLLELSHDDRGTISPLSSRHQKSLIWEGSMIPAS